MRRCGRRRLESIETGPRLLGWIGMGPPAPLRMLDDEQRRSASLLGIAFARRLAVGPTAPELRPAGADQWLLGCRRFRTHVHLSTGLWRILVTEEQDSGARAPGSRVESLFVDGAPEAIGPYCHASRVGDLVFCSGQTPLDPGTGHLVGDDIAKQTEQVFDNLETVLGGLGLGLGDVAKVNVYLSSMENFEGMNRIYAARFGAHRPARTTVAVRANPKAALVEIECIAAAR